MPRTVEAVVDTSGQIRLLESLPLRERQRVLVTVLDEGTPASKRSYEEEMRQEDMIGRLVEEPLKQKCFNPLSREETHGRG